MLADYEAGRLLQKRFPNRVLMLKYEDFSEPYFHNVSKMVLRFTRMPPTVDLSGIKKLNEEFIGYQRQEMTSNILVDINVVCKDVMIKLGYNLSNKLKANDTIDKFVIF